MEYKEVQGSEKCLEIGKMEFSPILPKEGFFFWNSCNKAILRKKLWLTSTLL